MNNIGKEEEGGGGGGERKQFFYFIKCLLINDPCILSTY